MFYICFQDDSFATFTDLFGFVDGNFVWSLRNASDYLILLMNLLCEYQAF